MKWQVTYDISFQGNFGLFHKTAYVFTTFIPSNCCPKQIFNFFTAPLWAYLKLYAQGTFIRQMISLWSTHTRLYLLLKCYFLSWLSSCIHPQLLANFKHNFQRRCWTQWQWKKYTTSYQQSYVAKVMNLEKRLARIFYLWKLFQECLRCICLFKLNFTLDQRYSCTCQAFYHNWINILRCLSLV